MEYWLAADSSFAHRGRLTLSVISAEPNGKTPGKRIIQAMPN
jgi:hypothetical protein